MRLEAYAGLKVRVLGALASVLGGLGLYAAAEWLDGNILGAAAGFASWHAAMCLALHFGGETSAAGRRIAQLIERKPASGAATLRVLQIGHAARC